MRSTGNADDLSSDDEAPDISLGKRDNCEPSLAKSGKVDESTDEEGHSTQYISTTTTTTTTATTTTTTTTTRVEKSSTPLPPTPFK